MKLDLLYEMYKWSTPVCPGDSHIKGRGYSSYLLGVKNAVLVPLGVFSLSCTFYGIKQKNMIGDNELF